MSGCNQKKRGRRSTTTKKTKKKEEKKEMCGPKAKICSEFSLQQVKGLQIYAWILYTICSMCHMYCVWPSVVMQRLQQFA